MIKLRLAILFLLVVCTSAISLLQKQLLDKTILRHTKQKTSSFPVPDKKYGAFYMEMPLDHFNDTNRKTFDNRYWMNSDYYKSDGPIILYNVGESEADRAAMFVKVSTMAQLAEKLNGILIVMEHRFYGSSGPEVNDFFEHTKEDLKTFNTKQALADMAYLISNIEFEKINVPPVPKTKAVVYGCSYSGSLAAWAKDTYPELFFAAVSSSAPVQADMDFYQYFDPIMRYGPKQCISALQKVIEYVDQILFHGYQEEVTKVKKLFHSQNLYDQTFGQILMGNIALAWQYGINHTYNAFEETVCPYLSADANDVEANLVSYSKYINQVSMATLCDSGTKNLDKCLVELNSTDIEFGGTYTNTDMAWLWQTCFEFGYYQAAPPERLPSIVSRKFNYKHYLDLCQSLYGKYGVPSVPNAEGINKAYGGWSLELERTIWIDGEWDSWRELSVNSLGLRRKFDSGLSKSIIIPQSTHCLNVAAVTKDSPKFLVDAFIQQYETLYAWLNEPAK